MIIYHSNLSANLIAWFYIIYDSNSAPVDFAIRVTPFPLEKKKILSKKEIDFFACNPVGRGTDGSDCVIALVAAAAVGIDFVVGVLWLEEGQLRVVVLEEGGPVADAYVGDIAQEAVHSGFGPNIHGARGLIEDHQPRFVDQDPAKGKALLLAEGQDVPPIQNGVQTEEGIAVSRSLCQVRQVDAFEAVQEHQIVRLLRQSIKIVLGVGRVVIAATTVEGIQELVPQRTEGAIGPLRQEIDV
jgi:hypothetical protein